MAGSEIPHHITEIQPLLFLPNSNPDSWSSTAREALREGLRVTASHPSCLGIFWMKKEEKPEEFVVFSSNAPSLSTETVLDKDTEWMGVANETDSKSYIPALRPHLAAATSPSIRMGESLRFFSGYSNCNILTFYYHADVCTSDFETKVSTRVKGFLDETLPILGRLESLTYITSGWTKGTATIEERDVKGFLLCLAWTDRPSELRYKVQNRQWRSLVKDLKTMGSVMEDEFHGRVMQVLGDGERERLEHSEDSDDNIDEDLDILAEAVDGLKKQAEKNLRSDLPTDHRCCQDFQIPQPEPTDEHGKRNRLKLKRIE
jgi:hypothetical protein